MKILMINPQASPKMPYDGPPLSVLSAVSMVDDDRHDIRVIDWHRDNYEECIRELARDSDICGITCMTGHQIRTMLDALKIVKEVNPDVLTVCGGCHPTLASRQTLSHELIDVVVIGQGPRTFAEFVQAVDEQSDLRAVKGIGFKRNGEFIFTEPRGREDINNFPRLPYHLLEDFEQYLVHVSFADRALYYLTSEGCPGACKFCAEESLYHRRWKSLSTDRVISDIQWLRERYDFDGVVVADSNFYVSEKRTIEFCEKMIPLNMKWGSTSGRPDQLRRYKDETFELMKRSGLHDIFLGVESGSDLTLDIMHKGCKTSDTLEVLPRLHRAGIIVQCSFIIGVPGVDVKEDLKSTMAFINELRKTGYVSQFHLFVYTPLPGTGFLEEAEKQGYKVPERLEDWTHYELHAHTTPWIPKRYAQFTDAASIYFMFLAGHARRVVEAVVPKRYLPLARVAERAMYHVSRFRISTTCFVFPIEYHMIKWILLHKERFFGDAKLLF